MGCELFNDCGYIQKLERADRIYRAGIISIYCEGKELSKCQRRRFYLEYGKLPPDNFAPDGNKQGL